MSEENVRVMRTAMEAFNRRDGTGFDAVLANDAEIVPVRSALEGTVYRGTGAGSQYCIAVEETWDDLRWEVEEMRVGAGWVLALGRIRGQGHDTGVAIDSKAGWLAHFRDGLITRFQTYANRAKAVEAVGLSE
jgi:ketosteroid isomerase-like protein